MRPNGKLFEIQKKFAERNIWFSEQVWKDGIWWVRPQRVPRNSCRVAARPGILSYSPTSICNGVVWYGMHHVVAVHTYLAKAMTTFMESDSKTNNDEKGTHAIIMSGKVTFSQRSLNFGKGSKVTPVVYLSALTHHHFGNPDHPDRPHHHDHPDYRHHPHHPDSHWREAKKDDPDHPNKKSVQYCDVRAVLHSCNFFSMKRPWTLSFEQLLKFQYATDILMSTVNKLWFST